MAKRSGRKGKPKDRELLHWRLRIDEQLFGRGKELWPTAPSLNPNPHTIETAVLGGKGQQEAWAIVNSYRLLITPTVVSPDAFRAMCIAGGEGISF